MKVDIFSDLVCPWCYLGRARFQAAVAGFDGRSGEPPSERSGRPRNEAVREASERRGRAGESSATTSAVEMTWRPFQLDPAAPATSAPAMERLAAKFGGRERVAEMHDRMRGLTAEAGLPYEPERALRANTRDAHRVVWLAGRGLNGEGVQDAVVGRLFRAYHAEGLDIADAETLASLAAEAGLPGDRVRDMLASDEGTAEVTEDLELARQIGISGVPFFLFEGAWAVSGAQPTDVFGEALHEVAGRVAVQH